MANIKSAKKRIEVIDKKTLRNKMIKSKVKTVIKKVEAAIAAGDKEAAQANLLVAISEIDKAASKGVYHKNNASRKVSRLTAAVNQNRQKNRTLEVLFFCVIIPASKSQYLRYVLTHCIPARHIPATDSMILTALPLPLHPMPDSSLIYSQYPDRLP